MDEKTKVSVELSGAQLKIGYILLFSILGGSPLYVGYSASSSHDKEIINIVERLDDVEDKQEQHKDEANNRLTILEITYKNECKK